MKTKERVFLGILGALLGSILGSVSIVLENQVSNTFSLIGGVAMAAFTLQGYIQLAGRLSKKGVAISLVLMAVMCALANQVNCTIEIMETVEAVQGMDFLESFGRFEELPEVREIRSWYGSQLLLLYLFTLCGSLLILVRSLWKPKKEARRKAVLEEVLLGEEPEEEKPELQGTLYPFRKAWMKPVRVSAGGAAVALLVALVALMMLMPRLEERFQIRLEFGMILGIFLSFIPLMWISLTITRYCNVFQILYVRAAGRIWRVNLMKLCRVGDWEALPPARQAVVQDDILWELENILKGDLSACDSGAVTELRDIQAEKEDRWSWTISYETDSGSRKKLKIPEGYPDFVPVMGMERAEGPTPYRWLPGLAALVLTVVFLGGGFAVDRWRMSQNEGDAPAQNIHAVPEEPALPDVPVRVPETATEFVISEIRFQIDREFQYSRRRFLDGKTGTSYRVYTQYGVDAADSWDTLTSHIHTDDPLYDRFQAVYTGEDLLAPLGETSRYNIVSVYRTDGTICHTAAALSDTGALFTLETEHTQAGQSLEEVLANLMYTLKSVRFEGPEVTEENYQTKIHLSEIRNCAYMAAAYIKTDHFGHEAFVDVYVPYSDAPIYASEGRAIRTEAHGLRVYASIFPGENAKEVVEARQQVLASTGQIYEDGVDDQTYREDLDVACMLTVYEENGQKRNAVLYAESMWEGYYLLREITGLPEQIDEEYLPLLKELEGIFGLTMPVLEQLGE
nr:hypothetical protein [uncultured Oscillibacter sp.]